MPRPKIPNISSGGARDGRLRIGAGHERIGSSSRPGMHRVLPRLRRSAGPLPGTLLLPPRGSSMTPRPPWSHHATPSSALLRHPPALTTLLRFSAGFLAPHSCDSPPLEPTGRAHGCYLLSTDTQIPIKSTVLFISSLSLLCGLMPIPKTGLWPCNYHGSIRDIES